MGEFILSTYVHEGNKTYIRWSLALNVGRGVNHRWASELPIAYRPWTRLRRPPPCPAPHRSWGQWPTWERPRLWPGSDLEKDVALEAPHFMHWINVWLFSFDTNRKKIGVVLRRDAQNKIFFVPSCYQGELTHELTKQSVRTATPDNFGPEKFGPQIPLSSPDHLGGKLSGGVGFRNVLVSSLREIFAF